MEVMKDINLAGQSWADEVERLDQQKQAREHPQRRQQPQVEKLPEGVQLRESTEKIGEKLYRVVEHVRQEKYLVPLSVAQRRKWKKYGGASNDPPGPNPATTQVSVDEIKVDFVGMLGSTSEDGPNKTTVIVKCKYCGGDHFSKSCKLAGQMPEMTDYGAASAAAGGPGAAGGKYRPGGLGAPGTEDLFTVRVSNLPENVDEDDLKLLFGKAGNLHRVFLGKDKRTNTLRGFAFVTFRDRVSAERAIQNVNRHRYGYMVLHVDWANRGNKT